MWVWLLYNTLSAVGLSVMILLARRLLRMRPATEHLLWMIVLVQLSAPPLVHLTIAPNVGRGPAEPTAALRKDAGATPVRTSPSLARQAHVHDRRGAPDPVTARREPTARRESPEPVATAARSSIAGRTSPEPLARVAGADIAQYLLAVWAAGALLLGLLLVLQARRLAIRMRHAKPVPAALSDLALECARRLGVKCPAIYMVDQVTAPRLWCIGRPRILWPATLTSAAAPQVRCVLLHELAHVRRRDHWLAWLEWCLTCVCWWHPLFWWARARMRHCAELACDAWVVWAEPAQRREYAETLLQLSQQESSEPRMSAAWGVIGRGRKQLERRLIMLFREEVQPTISRTSCVVLLILSLLVLPGWLRPQTASGQAAEEPPPQIVPHRAEEEQPQAAPAGPAATAPATPPAQAPAAGRQAPGLPGSAAPDRTNPFQAGESATFAAGVGPAVAEPPRQAKLIRVFPVKHRDPQTLAAVVEGIIRITHSLGTDRLPADLVILATLQPGGMGMGGYGGMGVGMGMPGAGGYDMSMSGEMGMGSGGDMYGGEMMSGGGMPGGYTAPAPPVHLTVDQRTRSIIARGTKHSVETVGALVRAFDTPEDQLEAQLAEVQNIRLLSLKHRSASEMIKILRGLGIPVQVTRAPQSSNNTLVAIGVQQDIEQVAELIRSLDVKQEK